MAAWKPTSQPNTGEDSPVTAGHGRAQPDTVELLWSRTGTMARSRVQWSSPGQCVPCFERVIRSPTYGAGSEVGARATAWAHAQAHQWRRPFGMGFS